MIDAVVLAGTLTFAVRPQGAGAAGVAFMIGGKLSADQIGAGVITATLRAVKISDM
jgi:hypothetical protein